jgi:CO/xanthine dehydrogenase Mo-binding subunit
VGRGLACGTEKGGHVATVAGVRVVDKRIEPVRLVTAFECGALVNPDNTNGWKEPRCRGSAAPCSKRSGEAPIIAVAPAIRNALAALTGQRLFALPLRLA